MAGWILPTSASGWNSSLLAIDGTVSTRANRLVDSYVWSPYLYVTYVGGLARCSKIRFYVYTHFSSTQCQIDVLIGGIWSNLYSGGCHNGSPYQEVFLSEQSTLDQIRIRFRPPGNELLQLAEVQAYQEDEVPIEEPEEEVILMGQRDYRVNEPITILYQSPNRESGKTVVVEVYLPSGNKDSNFPDFNLTERGSSGTYVGSFIPDELGEWQAIIHLDDGSGQVTKRYSVGTYDVTGVGVAVEGVEDKVDIIDSVVDGMDTQLDTMEGKIDDINIQVGSIDSPPMVS